MGRYRYCHTVDGSLEMRKKGVLSRRKEATGNKGKGEIALLLILPEDNKTLHATRTMVVGNIAHQILCKQTLYTSDFNVLVPKRNRNCGA